MGRRSVEVVDEMVEEVEEAEEVGPNVEGLIVEPKPAENGNESDFTSKL